MLNIELVRFEAQDVITASVMKPHHKPNKPQKPVTPPVVVPPVEVPTPEPVPCTCALDGAMCEAWGHPGCSATEHDCN